MDTPRVVGVIPARGGSKRLPRKNLQPLRGAPLIAYTIAAARAARSLDAVLVSSDDAEILEVAGRCGAEPVPRPAELATDGAPIDDALRHALQWSRARHGVDADILVWLQADVPVRAKGCIDRTVEMLCGDPKASAVATANRVTQHPAWMKTIDADGYASRYDADATEYRFQGLTPLYLLDGAVVTLRAGNLFAYGDARGIHRYLGDRPRLVVQAHPMYSLNVEEPAHVELAEFYLERHPEYRLS